MSELATSCVTDQDVTTEPWRHMQQTASLNWPYFTVQITWIHWISIPIRENSTGLDFLSVNQKITTFGGTRDYMKSASYLQAHIPLPVVKKCMVVTPTDLLVELWGQRVSTGFKPRYSQNRYSCNDRKFQITTSWHFAVSSRRNLPSYPSCFLWPRHHQTHHFSHKTLSQLAFPSPFCRVICFMLTINLEICAVPSVYRSVVGEQKTKQLNAA